MYQELRKKGKKVVEAGRLQTYSDAIMVLAEGCVKP